MERQVMVDVDTVRVLSDAPSRPQRASYAELEAIIEQVRAFARQPDARVEDGFDPQFVAGDASCRRGLRKIPGIGEA